MSILSQPRSNILFGIRYHLCAKELKVHAGEEIMRSIVGLIAEDVKSPRCPSRSFTELLHLEAPCTSSLAPNYTHIGSTPKARDVFPMIFRLHSPPFHLAQSSSSFPISIHPPFISPNPLVLLPYLPIYISFQASS